MGLEGPFNFGDGSHAADGGHISLVEVAESRSRFAAEVRRDDFGEMVAHLHGGLRNAGDLVAVLLEMSEIAKDEDLRKIGRVELVVAEHCAALVSRRAEKFAERRGLNACGPQSNDSLDVLAVGLNPSGTDSVDLHL